MNINGPNSPLTRKKIQTGYVRAIYKRWTNIRAQKDCWSKNGKRLPTKYKTKEN